MPESKFVEFAGKKEYKCPRCKAPIRYAKYFGSDGKLLTTDGKEPFAGNVDGKFKSNTGWPTDEVSKTMHECNKKQDPHYEDAVLDNEPINYEEGVKRTDLLTPQAKDFDSIIMKNAEEEAYHTAKLVIAHLRGVKRACKEDGIEEGPVSGMVFNKTEDRLRREHDSG